MSGGADSTCLALLARDWARARGGDVVALIVDHGLRPESGTEAVLVQARMASAGIAADILRLQGLQTGAALAARARAARYAALEAACFRRGALHLLVGHHAGDQVETRLLRSAAGSGADGMAGMAALVERAGVRLLRPLLAVAPGRLRATLAAAGLPWVEDPSNHDPRWTRVRVREAWNDAAGDGVATRREVAAASAGGAGRRAAEAEAARALAERVTLYAGGYAVLRAGPLPARALAALLRVIGGRDFAPEVARLAPAPRPATLGGVRLLPAGRMGPAGALLVVREAAAMQGPVPALAGAVWDRRFRLVTNNLPTGATLGALGEEAAAVRRRVLPDSIARGLPALRIAGKLAAVPHLGYVADSFDRDVRIVFAPPSPLTGAGFFEMPAETAPADQMDRA